MKNEQPIRIMRRKTNYKLNKERKDKNKQGKKFKRKENLLEAIKDLLRTMDWQISSCRNHKDRMKNCRLRALKYLSSATATRT